MRAQLVFLGAVLPFVSAAKWKIEQDNFATILMGVDFVDGQTGYLSGASDGIGNQIFHTVDGGATWTNQLDEYVSMMLMGIGVAKSDSSGHVEGISCGLGMGKVSAGVLWSADGEHWTPEDDAVFSSYQDCQAVSDGSLVAFGDWPDGSGVVFLRDGNLNYRPWGMDTYARYGSFLSQDVGFVTGGTWPSEHSERVATAGRGDAQVSMYLRGGSGSAGPDRTQLSSGYRGVIARTLDGGETFEKVFDSSEFYFNGINCVDETHCWAVGENDIGGYIYATSDGFTWTQQMFEKDLSLFNVQMIDSAEGWAVGAMISGYRFTAAFYHTVDGGATWTLDEDSLLPVYPSNIDVVNSELGWGTAFNAIGNSALLKFSNDDDESPAGRPVLWW